MLRSQLLPVAVVMVWAGSTSHDHDWLLFERKMMYGLPSVHRRSVVEPLGGRT
jgi:hypothetical protein